MSTVTDLFLQIFNILGTCKLQTKLCSFRRSSQEGCQQSTTGLRHWFCLQSYSWKHIETLLTLKLISAFILYANHERREYTTKDFHFEPCHIGSASLLPIIIPVHLKKESHHEWNQNDLGAFQTHWLYYCTTVTFFQKHHRFHISFCISFQQKMVDWSFSWTSNRVQWIQIGLACEFKNY